MEGDGHDIRGVDQTHAARLLGSTLNGFISLESQGGIDHSEPDPQVSWDRILDMLLRNWPAT